MDLLLGTSYYTGSSGDFPEFPVINMYAEEAPSEDKVSLLSRPGLTTLTGPIGNGPIRHIFRQEGIFGGDYFYLSGTHLYRNAMSLGEVDGSDAVSMAGYENFLFLTAGANLWAYDGSSLFQVPFPDNASVSKVRVGASRLIALKKGSQQFYWTDPLGDTIDDLAFASAENSTDFLYDAVFVGDALILFGGETIEFWPISDDADLPFVPLRGRTFPKGVKNTGAAVAVNSSFVWVTDDNQVCYSDPNTVISFPGLEAQIATSSQAMLWIFEINGDNCLAMELDNKTWIFHSRSKLWSEFVTNGYSKWNVSSYSHGRFGSAIDGRILEFNVSYTDDGLDLERRFRAWTPITTGGVVVNDLTIRTNPGQTPFLTGLYSNPSIEMRLSRNGGNTWGSWRARRLGNIGEYKKWTKWNSNGMFGYPGVLAEFRVSDPIPFRVSSVSANEPRGGL